MLSTLNDYDIKIRATMKSAEFLKSASTESRLSNAIAEASVSVAGDNFGNAKDVLTGDLDSEEAVEGMTPSIIKGILAGIKAY